MDAAVGLSGSGAEGNTVTGISYTLPVDFDFVPS